MVEKMKISIIISTHWGFKPYLTFFIVRAFRMSVHYVAVAVSSVGVWPYLTQFFASANGTAPVHSVWCSCIQLRNVFKPFYENYLFIRIIIIY